MFDYRHKIHGPLSSMDSLEAVVEKDGKNLILHFRPQFDIKIEDLEFDGFPAGTRVRHIIAADYVILDSIKGVPIEKIEEKHGVRQDTPINMIGGLDFTVSLILANEVKAGAVVGEVHFKYTRKFRKSFHEMIKDYERMERQRNTLMRMLNGIGIGINQIYKAFEPAIDPDTGKIDLDVWDGNWEKMKD